MRVNYLQLSNILSFKYEEDINNAFKIEFNPDLNIIIGENGSGKTTVLEAMNLVFTRALFKRITNRYSSHHSYYTDRKNMLQIDDNYSNRTLGLRLQPNWSSEDVEQSEVVRRKALQIGLSQKILTETKELNSCR